MLKCDRLGAVTLTVIVELESARYAMTTSDSRHCQCGDPARWLNNPKYPIEFDEKMNEYHLVRDGAKILMRYCFSCGGRLADSNRHLLSTTPSESEILEVRDLLKDAKSHEDVLRILGPADEFHDAGGSFGNPGDAFYSRWDRHYVYLKRWKTLRPIVPVVIEGQFCYLRTGQRLNTNS